MKKCMLMTILTAMFVSPAVFAQEPFEEEPSPREAMEHEVRMRNMQRELAEQEAQAKVAERMRQIKLERENLELRRHEAELNFDEEMRRLELEKQRMAFKQKHLPLKNKPFFVKSWSPKMLPLLAICLAVHILVAVWVYQDLRRRNAGSGIWIVIALLTGLLGTLVYAVVRLGDSRQTQS